MYQPQANILTPEQLESHDVVMQALAKHFGGTIDATGAISTKRTLPDFLKNQRVIVRRHDIFERLALAAATQGEFFRTAYAPDSFAGNLLQTVMPNEHLYVFTGIQITSGTGATVDAVAFAAIAAAALVNGKIKSFEANGVKVIENQPLNNKFNNSDSIPNYHRFSRPVVLEPNNEMSLLLKFAAALAANTWVEVTLVGYKIEKAPAA